MGNRSASSSRPAQNDAAKAMMRVPLSVIAITAGITLIVCSVLWPRLFVTEWVWDQDQAKQYREAGVELHRLSHQHGGSPTDRDRDGEEEDAELAAARKRYEQMTAQLESARSWRDSPAAWMKWAGVSIALVGVFATLALGGREK